MQEGSHKFEMEIVGFPTKISALLSLISFEETRTRINHVSTMLLLLFSYNFATYAMFWICILF
ncbi:hypothetical protein YC2023_004928 [Brassica napus]